MTTTARASTAARRAAGESATVIATNLRIGVSTVYRVLADG